MSARKYSLWTTLALLPATVTLLKSASLLGFVYAASFVVTMLYHASVETRWRKTDHVLAYGVIASNTWMALNASSWVFPILGIFAVCLALVAYSDAKSNPGRYDRSHAVWHVLSGIAGFIFALGYRG